MEMYVIIKSNFINNLSVIQSNLKNRIESKNI